MVCSTDRSKAVIPVLVLLLVALWFVLRGDLLYVFPCVVFFLVFFSPFSIAITSLEEERANLSAFRTFVRSVSSSSWGLGRAAVCDCGTPWTFLLLFFHMQVESYNGEEEGTVLDNSHYVGENCLTYCNREDGEKIRSKIYNKFAQEVESDSVRDNFGHHLYGWCHAGGIYKDTIKGALEHGLLRMETTYYGRIPTQEEMDASI